MYCTNCGKQNDDNAQFCSSCGFQLPQSQTYQQSQAYQQTPPVQQSQAYQQPKVASSGNAKVFKILSYIGILWLIGLLVKPEKDDPRVKFHVGQGILLTIVSAAANIIIGILSGILNGISASLFGCALAAVISVVTSLLSWAISIGTFVLMIIGIVNAVNDVEKELPIIGKYAFYK